MKNLKKTILFAMAAGFSIILAPSCSNEKDTKEVAEESNDAKFDGKTEKDADYLADAYLSNMFEIKMSENAASNATTSDVKQLAVMLIEKHTEMNGAIRTMAAEKNITLPTDITSDQQDKISKLAEKKGMDYDKSYTETMKDKHEDAVKNYQKISEKSEDPAVKEWATANVSEVQSHLDMVKSTYEKIKDMK